MYFFYFFFFRQLVGGWKGELLCSLGRLTAFWFSSSMLFWQRIADYLALCTFVVVGVLYIFFSRARKSKVVLLDNFSILFKLKGFFVVVFFWIRFFFQDSISIDSISKTLLAKT